MAPSKTPDARRAYLAGIVENLPDTPGCYQYLDEEGTIIYVGKAKRLKRRVSSYFNKDQQTRKTRMLVSKIHDIKYIVVRTEEDALLLENNLIKRYKPRYNVLLKDDKTYPSIAISNEPYPRIFRTRQTPPGGAVYYGPYAHIPTMMALLDLIKELYHPRTCHLALTEKAVKEGRFNVCLDYHIHNCKGPCIGKQTLAEYNQIINDAREILRGNTAEISRRMLEDMRRLAEEMRFEEAQEIKKQYDLIENFRAKSEIVNRSLHNIDVFAIEADEQHAYINYLHITKGSVNQAFTFEYRKRLEETPEELLTLGIAEMRARYHSTAREIIVPFPLELNMEGVTVCVPQRGDKHKLLALSQLNVKQYKFDRIKQAEKLNPEQKSVRLMKEIQDQLKLPRLPLRIELFDNSNIAGSDAVAGCVVFEKLRPAKKEYRRYIIRTVAGPDDYASMQEVVRRRYRRAVEEGSPLPDLLITDGGKGQMEVVRRVVEDELGLQIPIAGLAKDDRHRTHELLFGFPPATIGLRPESQLFKVLTQMQDEVHRYAITFHREKRSKRQTASELDGIPGVGEKTKELLIKSFGSLKRIREASCEELEGRLGAVRGKKLFEKLHENDAG